jgi:hypothetical protein
MWFHLQTLSRVGQSLPIPLPELNTVAHSVCALIFYVLWWHKLLDVGQATSLAVKDAQVISAILSLTYTLVNFSRVLVDAP